MRLIIHAVANLRVFHAGGDAEGVVVAPIDGVNVAVWQARAKGVWPWMSPRAGRAPQPRRHDRASKTKRSKTSTRAAATGCQLANRVSIGGGGPPTWQQAMAPWCSVLCCAVPRCYMVTLHAILPPAAQDLFVLAGLE